jgi:hypothetical protein
MHVAFDEPKIAFRMLDQGLLHVQEMEVRSAATKRSSLVSASHSPTKVGFSSSHGIFATQILGIEGVLRRSTTLGQTIGSFELAHGRYVLHKAKACAVFAPGGADWNREKIGVGNPGTEWFGTNVVESLAKAEGEGFSTAIADVAMGQHRRILAVSVG